jgi:hypothetical protein
MRYEICLSQFVHVKLSFVQKSGMLPVREAFFARTHTVSSCSALMVMVRDYILQNKQTENFLLAISTMPSDVWK